MNEVGAAPAGDKTDGTGSEVPADPATSKGGSAYTRGDQETRLEESAATTVDSTDRTPDVDGRPGDETKDAT